MPELFVKGMGGMGDAIHQRALIRRWLEAGYGPIWIKTSHPELLWDFRQAAKVKCVPLHPPLRTQAKNERTAVYDARNYPAGHEAEQVVWYTPGCIKRHGSLLKAMAEYAKCEGAHDISLPIHLDWKEAADAIIERLNPGKPLLVVRPPVLRHEWNGPARNPDPAAVRALVDSVGNDFYVISVADLVPGVEWIDGEAPYADVRFHAGELHFTTIAALMARPGSVVISPPGFGMVMGRAVGAWTCGAFGSFELPAWWEFGTPQPDRFMTIAPIREIPDEELWRKELDCDKTIDVSAAIDRFKAFTAAAVEEYGRFPGGVRLAATAS